MKLDPVVLQPQPELRPGQIQPVPLADPHPELRLGRREPGLVAYPPQPGFRRRLRPGIRQRDQGADSPDASNAQVPPNVRPGPRDRLTSWVPQGRVEHGQTALRGAGMTSHPHAVSAGPTALNGPLRWREPSGVMRWTISPSTVHRPSPRTCVCQSVSVAKPYNSAAVLIQATTDRPRVSSAAVSLVGRGTAGSPAAAGSPVATATPGSPVATAAAPPPAAGPVRARPGTA